MKPYDQQTSPLLLSILLAVFLVSLQSLYFDSLGAPAYSVLGTLLLLLLGAIHLWKTVPAIVLFPFSVIIFFFLSSVLRIVIFPQDVAASRVLGFPILLGAVLAAVVAYRHARLETILRVLLVTHISLFFLQFFLYYALGLDFDPVALLSQNRQQGWGGTLDHALLGPFRRLGGLYAEPGTYATFVAPVIALFFRYQGNSRLNKVICWAGLVSLLLTFSIYGWIFLGLILVVALVSERQLYLSVLVMILPAYWLAEPYFTYRFVDFASRGGDAGLGFRVAILSSVWEIMTSSLLTFSLGIGLLNTELPFDFSGAINDIGLFFYLLLTTGIIGTGVFLAMLTVLVRRADKWVGAASVIIVLSKASVFAPFLWLLISMMAVFRPQGWRLHGDALQP
jgi:hypothetical protein